MENNTNKPDGIARPELNLLFVVDNSGSMSGNSIASVNNAIRDVMTIMPDIQEETSNAEIKLNALIFSDDAHWLYDSSKSVDSFKWKDINTEGGTDFSKAYDELGKYLTKKKNGGSMPDFGGVAPIVLFMTDGYPTSADWKMRLETLKKKGWFKAALKYALAIGADSDEALENLREFTGNIETVLKVYTAEALRQVIKVIAVSSTKIKSSGTSSKLGENDNMTNNDLATQDINNKLQDMDNVEW